MSKESLVELEYQKGKDGLLCPRIQISEDSDCDQRMTQLFGRQWKDYMRERYPQRLSELIAQGKINEKICQVDEEAESKKEELIQLLLEAQPIPETEDMLVRAGHMGMITRQAEEIALDEVVYQFH